MVQWKTIRIRKKIYLSCPQENSLYIKQYPKAVATRYDDIRTAVLDTFPYIIHFTIDDHKKLVVISAVLSASRDPNIWKERE